MVRSVDDQRNLLQKLLQENDEQSHSVKILTPKGTTQDFSSKFVFVLSDLGHLKEENKKDGKL